MPRGVSQFLKTLAQRNVLLTRRWLFGSSGLLSCGLAGTHHTFSSRDSSFFAFLRIFLESFCTDSGKFAGISNTEINCHVVCQWRKSCEFVASLGSFLRFFLSACRIVLARANFILAVLDQLPTLRPRLRLHLPLIFMALKIRKLVCGRK